MDQLMLPVFGTDLVVAVVMLYSIFAIHAAHYLIRCAEALRVRQFEAAAWGMLLLTYVAIGLSVALTCSVVATLLIHWFG